MGRVIRWLISLALITFGLLWPLVFTGSSDASDVDDPVVFSNYKADFVVNRDGRLDAVETITGEFPSGRHGIFQWWDVSNQNNAGLRQKPEISSILLDGEPISYQMMWEGGQRFRVAKIGDPDRTLTWGTHVFEIRYSIPDVLDPGTTGANKTFAASTGQPSLSPSVFLWDVVGRSWNNSIGQADISVTLPGDIGRVQCSVGVGVGRQCQDVAINGDTVTFSAVNLAPRTPVTVRAGVDVPTPPQASLPWPSAWDRILGQSVIGVVWIAGCRSGIRARCVPVVPHHRRAAARLSAAVRASAGPRAGADRVHPHRDGSEERTHRHAVLPRRAQADRPEAGQRQAVEHPRHRRTGRMGRRGSGQHRGRVCAQGDEVGSRLRGQTVRDVRARNSTRPRPTWPAPSRSGRSTTA